MSEGYDPHQVDALEAFIRLFNHEEFFESHEVLEALWHQHGGETALFYQGLIQLAVALEHLTRRNLQGARRLLAQAENKLESFYPEFQGLPVARLVEATKTCLEEQRVDGPYPKIGPPAGT